MKVITANRLTDGRVVYRRKDGDWGYDIEAAELFTDDDAKEALESALSEERSVVGPYLIDVEAREPTGQKRLRETIRLTGPSAGSSRPNHVVGL